MEERIRLDDGTVVWRWTVGTRKNGYQENKIIEWPDGAASSKCGDHRWTLMGRDGNRYFNPRPDHIRDCEKVLVRAEINAGKSK